MEDRAEAKLYVLRAYNMDPSDPVRQKAMGDFHYSFQEYSTAVEYYKAALASGLLRDYTTNIRIAKCFEKLDDINSALQQLEKAVEIFPDCEEAHEMIRKLS